MAIYFHTEDIQFDLKNKTTVKTWIRRVIEQETGQAGDINFVFCSDKYLLGLNRQYLAHDYFTDVITFDYSDDNTISGDIFLSIETIRDNSQDFQTSFKEELMRVMVHGVLHLIGYDDKQEDEEIQMRSKEEQYLTLFYQEFDAKRI